MLTQSLTTGLLLFLPLPPSNNDLHVPFLRGRFPSTRRSKEADQYIKSAGISLRLWSRQSKFNPISYWRSIDLWMLLPRINCDCHNYEKVLFDSLQEGGIVLDDRYLIPRIMGIAHLGRDDAQVIVKI